MRTSRAPRSTIRTGNGPAGLARALACIVAPLVAGGCQAPAPKDPEALADYRAANDPYEPTNRVFYAVNDRLDRAVLKPGAEAYRAVVPAGVRPHVHDVLTNIANPVQFANDVLEGRPRRAGDTFVRFVVNSTVGLGGVFDPAASLGYPDHDNDMGLTLALWGFGTGPYLFLPVLGPNDPRDAIGYGLQSGLDPFTYVSFNGVNSLGWGRFGLGAVDQRSRVLHALDEVNANALDPYATIRSLYRQHRTAELAEIRADRRATVPDWYAASPPPAPPPPVPSVAAPGVRPLPSGSEPLNPAGASHP